MYLWCVYLFISISTVIFYILAEKLAAETGNSSQNNMQGPPPPLGELHGEQFTLSLTKGTQVCDVIHSPYYALSKGFYKLKTDELVLDIRNLKVNQT